jgi:FMN-dependent NADH-azoreductase
MILFINGCVRPQSRTRELAQAVLAKLDGPMEEVCLATDGPAPMDYAALTLRDKLLSEGDFDHPLLRFARQFAAADTIVVAAPYWDLLFPATVRAYFEAVTVSGITFRYDDHGVPCGLCRAKKLIYVTTAGGPIFVNFGFDYVKTLANGLFGISDVRCIKAEGLDIWGADVSAIMEKAKQEAETIMA